MDAGLHDSYLGPPSFMVVWDSAICPSAAGRDQLSHLACCLTTPRIQAATSKLLL